MPDLQRIMFMNYGSSEFAIEMTARETIGVVEMHATGDTETLIETHTLPGGQNTVVWELRIPAGKIRGFGVYQQLDFTDPQSGDLKINYANGKNPWPPPPPPPPPSAYSSSSDWSTR